ncbi:hypothetical protein NPIL_245901 [Nephila pilipes]|uniref:Uncharacterized protein n=1 Tax=Nephila pilipes TaxID=299642 RepID=A0A8X6JXY5_NEPPI|nr:hypothetical protein NPIL_245901 [Nephila pilipes]
MVRSDPASGVTADSIGFPKQKSLLNSGINRTNRPNRLEEDKRPSGKIPNRILSWVLWGNTIPVRMEPTDRKSYERGLEASPVRRSVATYDFSFFTKTNKCNKNIPFAYVPVLSAHPGCSEIPSDDWFPKARRPLTFNLFSIILMGDITQLGVE